MQTKATQDSQEPIENNTNSNELHSADAQPVDKKSITEDNKLKLFIRNDLIGGYSLAVRDNWGYKILRRHITDKEKELYVRDFGQIIISDDEFFEWWCRISDCAEQTIFEDFKTHAFSKSKDANPFEEDYF